MSWVSARDGAQSRDGGLKHGLGSHTSAARHFEYVVAPGIVVRHDARAAIRSDTMGRGQHERAHRRAYDILAVYCKAGMTGDG
jgi:hypothetical protein